MLGVALDLVAVVAVFWLIGRLGPRVGGVPRPGQEQPDTMPWSWVLGASAALYAALVVLP